MKSGRLCGSAFYQWSEAGFIVKQKYPSISSIQIEGLWLFINWKCAQLVALGSHTIPMLNVWSSEYPLSLVPILSAAVLAVGFWRVIFQTNIHYDCNIQVRQKLHALMDNIGTYIPKSNILNPSFQCCNLFLWISWMVRIFRTWHI